MEQLQQLWDVAYRVRRRLATWGLFVFAALIAAHVLFGTNGWMAYEKKKTEYRKVTEDVQRIQQENAQLEEQIKALKTDPKAIEKEAREQLRYAKPGEIVYVMPTPSQELSSTAQAQAQPKKK
ncbi:MAG TPA: septum formation initiator family protein [Terriglobales bacterium]|nr:septum formation initiator family protein [Terriglobales bacterium]